MATDSRSLPAFFNVDADFQSWCQGIAAQLVVAGMVKTSDSGQINNATVTKPSAINTAQGYEIYRFNDGLQNTYPIYIKVEYGSGGAADRPALWITVGQGSNGSGTLTGTTTTRKQIAAGASKSASATLNSYCSGDGSKLALFNNYDAATTTFAIAVFIDRLRDSNGNATSEGIFTYVYANGGSQAQAILGSSAQTAQTTAAFAGPTSMKGGGNSNTSGYVALMPAVVLNGQPRYTLTMAIFNGADITDTTSVTASLLNGSHTYQTMKSTGTGALASSSESHAMIWE